MSFENERIYPDCSHIVRTIQIGGQTKSQLLQSLHQNSILLNTFAEKLFADDRFKVSDRAYSVSIVELKVRDFGFLEGATIPQLYKKAEQTGLKPCPLELGPHLRVIYKDQPEGSAGMPIRKNRSPYGAVTVASKKLSEEADFPRGFYLRKIEGVLWLRGYTADDSHIFNPDDRMVFCCD